LADPPPQAARAIALREQELLGFGALAFDRFFCYCHKTVTKLLNRFLTVQAIK
jgi:hypothetical protein